MGFINRLKWKWRLRGKGWNARKEYWYKQSNWSNQKGNYFKNRYGNLKLKSSRTQYD